MPTAQSNLETTLPLILVCEPSRALATFVALYSFVAHHDITKKYHIHILSVGLSAEQENALQAFTQENIVISVYSVDSEKEETTVQDIVGILTLQLANIFWELETALYVDAHVLFQKDVHTLFALERGTAYATLAFTISATASTCSNKKEITHAQVMLLHLHTMRENSVVAELMACNVAKGDYAGYGKALCKVLSQNCLYLPEDFVTPFPIAQESDSLQVEKRSAVYFASHDLATARAAHVQSIHIWQQYAAKAKERYPEAYQLLERIS